MAKAKITVKAVKKGGVTTRRGPGKISESVTLKKTRGRKPGRLIKSNLITPASIGLEKTNEGTKVLQDEKSFYPEIKFLENGNIMINNKNIGTFKLHTSFPEEAVRFNLSTINVNSQEQVTYPKREAQSILELKTESELLVGSLGQELLCLIENCNFYVITLGNPDISDIMEGLSIIQKELTTNINNLAFLKNMLQVINNTKNLLEHINKNLRASIYG